MNTLREATYQSLPTLLGLILLVTFATATARLEKTPSPQAPDAEMTVALPRFIQVLMTGGDRFLAANLTVFRALMVSGDTQKPDSIKIQAILQRDAAWFNPYHEDNYYVAEAILPWGGQVDATQTILAAATDARTFDMLPPFFYGFNQYYFHQDPVGGAEWLKRAADHASTESQRIGLHKTAAHWMLKSKDRQQAIKLLEAMAKQATHRNLKQHILLRAERLRKMMQIESAVDTYASRHHHLPPDLHALAESGILARIPADPLGQDFALGSDGKLILMKKSGQK